MLPTFETLFICTRLDESSNVRDPPKTLTSFVIVTVLPEFIITFPKFTVQEHPAKSVVAVKLALKTRFCVPIVVGGVPNDQVPEYVFINGATVIVAE